MKKRIVLIVSVLFAFAIQAAAQGSLSLGPQVGAYKSRDADNVNLMLGAALRLRVMGLGVEGSANYRQEEFNNGYLKVKTWPVMLTGLLYPLPIVYGAIGAGWYNTTIDYNYPVGYGGGPGLIASETKQRFGWHFGGGVDLPAGPVSIIGDVRYVFLDYNFQTVPGVNGANGNFYVVTAGLLFNL